MTTDNNTTQTSIAVFGASSSHIEETYRAAAYELGRLMALRGWPCVNGAGSEGLMRQVSDGVLDAGGTAIGVIPQFMVDNGWSYSRLTRTIVTRDMHERKERMAQLASAFIALPGGVGTLEELLEMITWRQLHLHSKPIVLLNTLGFFDPLVEMLHRCAREGFMKPSHERLYSLAATPHAAIEQVAAQIAQAPAQAESKL